MKIRALTVGLSIFREDFILDNGKGLTQKLYKVCHDIEKVAIELINEGYEIQTKRISFNSFEEWMDPESINQEEIEKHMKLLVTILDANNIDFCSLGGCKSVKGLGITPTLLSYSSKLSSSFHMNNFDDDNNIVPSYESCIEAAKIVLQLSQKEESGRGNFNFCVAFNCPPNIPFFPVSYHTSIGKNTEKKSNILTIGLECGDLLFLAFHGVQNHKIAYENLKDVLYQAILPVQEIIENICTSTDLSFEYKGIDASMNPGLAMQDSVGMGIENLYPYKFGSTGTLATVATITSAIKSVQCRPISEPSIKLVGYSGLMLPVMEDVILASRASESPPAFTLRDLLFYSSVCGVGLDMVPVPGNTTPDQLAAIYMEVGTLSNKLNKKPLSARILPIPHKQAGEFTAIESEYLCQSKIFSVNI